APAPDRKKDPWYGTGEYASPLEGTPGGAAARASQWRSPLEETHRVSFDGVTGRPAGKDDPWYGTGEYKSPVG
ncbi:hypothetical protein LCGC14_2943140, partial [marine sediment metagenome]